MSAAASAGAGTPARFVLGIDDLSIATTSRVLDLGDLAAHTGVDPDKFRIGLGQDQMGVPAADEDIVTMAAAAAAPIIERHGADRIRSVLFATESGVDQSKSAAAFVHELLELPASCRVVEFKQACYGGTAALQAALGMVAREPDSAVLVIASDIARYEIDSAAEPTQGAAAVAMLVTSDPGLVEVEAPTGVWTEAINDFWRPNDCNTALVDGRLSVEAYMNAFVGAWEDYRSRGGADAADIAWWCHHQPFTRMAHKAHRHLASHLGIEADPAQVESSTRYNRRLGNSYTASLFVALGALLDGEEDLAGKRIGMYSYGSGSTGEVFSVVVQPGYRDLTRADATRAALEARTPIAVAEYRELHVTAARGSGDDVALPLQTPGPFRFAGITGSARRYEVRPGTA
ncbi:hydroxymethylglutaryl-CoA synthase [Microbacterium sp.]|uniref:hydroxymethylglutaryl-CoA synthase n=1 Tax=Microbacterium sp. TaxID=51671 RepID=UPI003C775669